MTHICPVCDGEDTKVQAKYRATNQSFAGINRAYCRGCRMIFASPMPSDQDLQNYNSRYYVSAYGGQAEHKSARAFFSAIALLRIAHIQRYLSKHNTKVSSILEVGPGPGYFARHWLQYTPLASYYAIESDRSCYASLTELGVRLREGLDEEIKPEQYDLVVMSHVLEHVPNPQMFLTQTTRNLRKGCALFIEVPCRDFEHKILNEPLLLFFDKQPMNVLLTKLGFTQIEVSYHGKLISDLRSPKLLNTHWQTVRGKLIRLGIVNPFSQIQTGMEPILDPYARAVIAPFQAHRESQSPAWWLRAVAIKN